MFFSLESVRAEFSFDSHRPLACKAGKKKPACQRRDAGRKTKYEAGNDSVVEVLKHNSKAGRV